MTGEWELLDAWRSGDSEAGNTLVGQHFPAISRYFRGKLGDDVEDIIQATFLACVEGRDRITGSFRSYLFSVATRRLFSHLRSSYKEANIDFGVSSMADLRTTASQDMAKSERARLLQTALRQIPIDSQIALELSYWEELSGAEIAIALGVEEGTVRSRLTRARGRLREQVLALGGNADELFSESMTRGQVL